MTEYGAFASWKYKHHFSNFRPKSGKSFTVECLLCLPLTKTLSASKDTTSNLKKHLEVSIQEERPLKQQKMDTAPHPCSQNKVNGLILRFVVEDVQSFSVVELPAFQDLVEGISGGRKVMCRKGLAARVEKAFQKMKEVLKEKLSEVKYVCTTADVWTARGRSFFAVTCHWIEEEDLVRRSAALACARIKGPLTYAVVAAKLQEIHAEYSIGGKVQCTFTDNGSAFVKAFGEFSRDEEDGNEEGSLSFEDLGVALDNGGDERPEPRFFLPPHMRCASQTLSLIASEDLKRAMSQEATRKLYLGSMAKCSAVWTRARASGQIWEGIGNTKPFVPAAARWSSEFAAVHRIASLAETRLKEVCEGLGLPTFQPHEMSFLREHVDVLRPLAVALELLQDEQKCFLGLVLPTLLTLKRKLSEKQPHVRFHANVIRAITDAIDSRFKDLFSSHDAQIATATLPQFRLWWLSGEDEKNVRKALLSEASHMAPRTHDSAAPACSESPEEDFFSFGPGSKSGPQRNAQDELARYLESCNKNLDSLTNFPTVKEIFLKYNMALPSGATVERLCVRGGDPFTPNRCRLSDVHFEQVLLLRYNGPISSLLLEE
uniref:Transposase n=1 Tax=Denticeps clupeoides TaxID=299321 RepID=A0AAY4BB86_9TELE